MNRARLVIDLFYEENFLYTEDDPAQEKWFFEDILKGSPKGSLSLVERGEIGDSLGTVNVVSVIHSYTGKVEME